MNDVSALFEIFPICQKFLLNTIDIPSMDLTKTQILILFALSGGRSLNMSQLSSYLASSKEQATRAVSPLVKDEYVTRFRSDENRKMVYVKLTEKGNQLILQEKDTFFCNILLLLGNNQLLLSLLDSSEKFFFIGWL